MHITTKSSNFTKLVVTAFGTIFTALAICASLTGCMNIYKKSIRQGNHVTQEMVNQLKPNMSKLQVQSIMGTPAMVPVFKLSRWDYYYSFKPGNGDASEVKSLALYFDGDKLKNYTGDWQLPNLPKRN